MGGTANPLKSAQKATMRPTIRDTKVSTDVQNVGVQCEDTRKKLRPNKTYVSHCAVKKEEGIHTQEVEK